MLVLASNSPRRKEILTAAGIPFVVRASAVPEELQPGESSDRYVRRLARDKARAAGIAQGDVVLGADTVVEVGGQILEKPRDSSDASWMLALLSGRDHHVLTGVCIRSAAGEIVDVASTRVRFAALSPEEIAAYVASGEPMDKAGGYAIQGLAAKFIERIEGCYFNVMGLPIALVYSHLKQMGGI